MIQIHPHIPPQWLPDCPMSRIVVHWTAGPYYPTNKDLHHYHFLIDGEARAVLGAPSVDLNSGTLKNGYAAHVRNMNTGSIGIAVCGMGRASEEPFDPGPWPITAAQWAALADALATLARAYRIPVDPEHVLTHAEVQPNLGVMQRGKWDIARLPFEPDIRGAELIGDLLRQAVVARLDQEPHRPALEPIPDGALVRSVPRSTTFWKQPHGLEVGNVPADTLLVVHNRRPGWLHVETPAGYTGWVRREAVSLVDGPPADEPSTPSSARATLYEMFRYLLTKLRLM